MKTCWRSRSLLWAANVFYTLGGVHVLQWTDAAFFYAPTANWLRTDHFVQRLTPAKVQAIISRVIRNAESANADPSRDFIIESLGIFGSVLADATSPGDVDVVFTARWRSNNRPLPEASYYPFDVSEPTNRVSRALSRGSRRMDLSSHYLLEVERLGAPYRIIWTQDEGCVDRPIITPKEAVFQTRQCDEAARRRRLYRLLPGAMRVTSITAPAPSSPSTAVHLPDVAFRVAGHSGRQTSCRGSCTQPLPPTWRTEGKGQLDGGGALRDALRPQS